MMWIRQRFIQTVSSLIIGGGVLVCAQAGYAFLGHGKASSKEAAHSVRNFLPPVATINPHIDRKTQGEDVEELEVVSLSAVSTPVLQGHPKITKLDSDLSVQTRTNDYQTLHQLQKELEEKDLNDLWHATVEKNPVIRFALEKISVPDDLHQSQSSLFMRKTLNTLISGATIAATMLPGAGYYQNAGAMAVGDAARNLMLGGPTPSGHLLSATEKIQLAGLVDDLQVKVIRTYHDYKNTLQGLTEAHQTTVDNNTLYSNALHSENSVAILAAGTAYYKALAQESLMRQQAKLHRLKLERLAGVETVNGLKLSVAYLPSLVQESPETEPHKENTASPFAPRKPSQNKSSNKANNNPGDALSQTIPPMMPDLLDGIPQPTTDHERISGK